MNISCVCPIHDIEMGRGIITLYLTEQKTFYSFNQNNTFPNYLASHKIISYTMICHVLGHLSKSLNY